MNDIIIDHLRDKLNPIVISARFADLGVQSDKIMAMTKQISMDQHKITKSGLLEEKGVAGEYILVFAFVMMLYVMLLSWGIAIMKSIIEEKSSRVIEVMLSSLEPTDMFIGKIVGLGALGFTQIAVWMVLMLSLASGLEKWFRISNLDV